MNAVYSAVLYTLPKRKMQIHFNSTYISLSISHIKEPSCAVRMDIPTSCIYYTYEYMCVFIIWCAVRVVMSCDGEQSIREFLILLMVSSFLYTSIAQPTTHYI